ncbi:MAG: hypothetical protein M3R44_00030 [Candidatus Eremiobacteraeota bacterium]|nr:hypothetical protein [Candidatus Eremiobacteraeota bacterium]
MKNRKTFLAALGIAGASFALRGRGDAQALPTTSASPAAAKPSPAATLRAKARVKRPSAAAAALAATFRRFDPKLSDEAVETIAHGIDDGYKTGAALNPKKKPLHNWNEPVTIFTVPA